VGREGGARVTLGSMANVEEWRSRVRDWRCSGQTADEFCRGRDFAASTLRWYSSRLGTSVGEDAAAEPRTAMVHVGAVRARERIVLEADGVRVHVPDGVDAATLRTVLDVLLETREDLR
jgi:transposase